MGAEQQTGAALEQQKGVALKQQSSKATGLYRIGPAMCSLWTAGMKRIGATGRALMVYQADNALVQQADAALMKQADAMLVKKEDAALVQRTATASKCTSGLRRRRGQQEMQQACAAVEETEVPQWSIFLVQQ